MASGLSTSILLAQRRGDAGGEGVGAVEMPVRVVGGEQQHVVVADLVEDARHAGGVGRRVGGLQGDAHVFADELGGRAVDPGHFGAHAAPGLVGAPEEIRQPGEAGFDQHDAESGEFGEHALMDQAQQLGLEGLGVADDILEVVGGPAIAGGGVAGGAAGVDADRQAVARGGLEDRPVLPLAERGVADGEQQHLHETGIGGAAVDLGRRRLAGPAGRR